MDAMVLYVIKLFSGELAVGYYDKEAECYTDCFLLERVVGETGGIQLLYTPVFMPFSKSGVKIDKGILCTMVADERLNDYYLKARAQASGLIVGSNMKVGDSDLKNPSPLDLSKVIGRN